MAYEHRAGQGTLGKAKTKTKDTSPDLTGKIKLPDGQEYWLSGWIKKASNGGEFYSLQIGNPVQQIGEVYSAAHKPFAQSEHERAKVNAYQPTNPMASSSGAPGFDDDGDIPF